MDAMSRALLTSVLSLPTMSFHETAIATFVRWYSQGLGLKVDEDDAGNLVVRYSGGKKGSVTYTAHMDHPGFEVVSSKGKTATVALWGKVAPKTFAGSKVVVYTSEGSFKGRIEKRVLAKKHLGRFCFAAGRVRRFAEVNHPTPGPPAARRTGRISYCHPIGRRASSGRCS